MEKQLSQKQIWVIEDDPGCQFVYDEILGLRHQVRMYGNLQEFKDALTNEETGPDLVIADIRLPDQSFLSYLSSGAPRQRDFPFIVVSSVDDLDVLRTCFEKGAVDYITKPFGKAELIIKTDRILAGLFSAKETRPREDISVDPTSLTVSRGGSASSVLTPKEFQIVSLMKQAPHSRLTREEMITRVWGSVTVSAKTLDVHLFHLRKKLAPLGLDILYIPPQSYRLLTRDED